VGSGPAEKFTIMMDIAKIAADKFTIVVDIAIIATDKFTIVVDIAIIATDKSRLRGESMVWEEVRLISSQL
jgi:hypothetical protein